MAFSKPKVMTRNHTNWATHFYKRLQILLRERGGEIGSAHSRQCSSDAKPRCRSDQGDAQRAADCGIDLRPAYSQKRSELLTTEAIITRNAGEGKDSSDAGRRRNGLIGRHGL